ncbi:ABC transporter ATP-binding protein [Rhizobium sp. SSA_523]|uniref:ABC transporter ATP-binding protein n=1 Tax=Rhizobium sp. SSA_523 TaxID=2952477 RepID=UPI00209177F8|nr:sn-glycerol-3-phosphate ABC transporter ATP-binding protein UgpC [Rhizobium sp. SSA_523]MCO5733240.1 sn-glycerol-3-phosphate ABC transporter ATP-binding protein UgpC [Rhizobium sp. SSA_523]WKC21774.1 sn-glycerol-3-phosphate ABC transporter ATP-binding protein UgpC [Rhizobium sp. SSA_523]
MGNTIELHQVSKAFDGKTVIPDLSAEFEDGEFVAILGPSGCGKSTMLNMIAGLERVSAGQILIGGVEVQDKAPKDRGCAMVFQNYALYPHMSVRDNIGYALKVAGVPKAERERRIAEAARVVELGDYLERRPSALSGGQRQRVAIARAIVREPKVLLFDEPLSNLDAKLRHGMRMELSQLHRRIGATSVFVTHDQIEAMTLADRVMLLNGGRIEQFASPHDLYHRPATTFVAGFIGAPPMNLMPVTGDGRALRLKDGTLLLQHDYQGEAILGIRPETIVTGQGALAAKLLYHEDLGSHSSLLVQLAEGQTLQIASPFGTQFSGSAEIRFHFPVDQIHLFDHRTGLRLEN